MTAMETGPGRGCFSIAFPANLTHIENTVGKALDLILRMNCPIDAYGFQMVLYEALSNAVLHGSASNPAWQISLEVMVTEGLLKISVEDQGEGFDWRTALKRRGYNLLSPSGRGLLLMRAYGYKPRYNDKGNKLILTKFLDPDSQTKDTNK